MTQTERTKREKERQKRLELKSQQLVNLLRFNKAGKYLGKV